MSRLQLTLGISEYDHVRDLCQGGVEVDGIDLTCLVLGVEEVFHRFINFREWDVSEMAFGKYVSLISQGDQSLVSLPVFPSRAFRHSAFYVRRGSGLTDPRQLKGKRVGVPEWAQTACVYARGVLMHQYGLRLADIKWFQAGVSQPGRTEKVALKLPEGVSLTPVPDKSLTGMLLAGELDCMISAHAPEPFARGDPSIVQLIADPTAVEAAYWRETGIFPIMHTVVIRREVYDRHRWAAMNLYKAFDEARRRSLARVFSAIASRYPVPWMTEFAARWRPLFGEEYWPYGLEANRTTLEALCEYALEQGVCHRRVTVEDLFVPEVLSAVRV